MIRTALIAVLAATVLAVTGCGGSEKASQAPQKGLTDLHDINQLRSAFQTASGEPRLIILVSPT